MAKKYYVVVNGVNPGIYDSWEDCKAQVCGYPNAVFKGFNLKRDAIKYLTRNTSQKKDATKRPD